MVGERGSNAFLGGDGVRYRDGMACEFFLKDVGMLALALSLRVDAPAGKPRRSINHATQHWSFRTVCSGVDIDFECI